MPELAASLRIRLIDDLTAGARTVGNSLTDLRRDARAASMSVAGDSTRIGIATTEMARDATEAGTRIQGELADSAARLGSNTTTQAALIERFATSVGGASIQAGGSLAEMARSADRAADRGGASADQWAADYRDAARSLGLSADQIEGEMARMARGADRASDRAGDAADRLGRRHRDAERDTGWATRSMGSAWRALDIVDDIGGVIGMVDGLTRGLREMMQATIEASREVESELARLASIDLEAAPADLAARREWADTFASQRGGAISELVAIRTPELLGLVSDAEGGGLRGADAERAAEMAAGLSRLPGAGAPDQSMDALMRMSLFADPARDMAPQLEGWADEVAETQRVFYVSALADLNEAISTGVGTAQSYGVDREVFLASLGTFHRVTSGSEAGEAFNSIMEEMVGGMRDMGLEPAVTAAGKLDFEGSLERLRAHRLERTDLTDVDWVSLLMENFGELGGREIGNLTGALWEEFRAGIPQIAAADEADMLTTRLVRMSDDRNLRAAQIDARAEVANAAAGDQNRWIDDLMLGIRGRVVDERLHAAEVVGSLRAGEQIPTESLRSLDILTRLDIAFTESFRRDVSGGQIMQVLFGSGAAMPATLAEGVAAGGPALGQAVEGMLNREVAPRMAHSDAEIGPLSRLTAAGRAIPETMAEGVALGAGGLAAALLSTLQLPGERLELGATFGPLAPPEMHEAGTLALAAAFGLIEPPLLPGLGPLGIDAAFSAIDPPLLPNLGPLGIDAAFSAIAPPLLPALGPLGIMAAFSAIAPPLLPNLGPLGIDAAFGTIDPPLLPTLGPLGLLAAFGAIAPPLLPNLGPLGIDAAFSAIAPPLLPALGPLGIMAAFSAIDPPLLPNLGPLGIDASFSAIAPPLLPKLDLSEIEASLGPRQAPLLSLLAGKGIGSGLDPAALLAALAGQGALPADRDALDALRRSVEELIAEMRTRRRAAGADAGVEHGGRVSIDHMELSLGEGETMRVLSDLVDLVGGRR